LLNNRVQREATHLDFSESYLAGLFCYVINGKNLSVGKAERCKRWQLRRNRYNIKKMKKITSKTILAEILEIQGAEKVLAKYNVPCLFCPMAAMEAGTLGIGEIAAMYGLDLKNLLEELNSLGKK